MQSKIPLYPYNAKTAQERGEIEKWRESFRENCACAGGIDILIRENFDGMHLKDGTVEKIVELYGYKRVEHVLANTVQERRGDGRFRPDNRAWANSHYIPPDEMHNYCFAARSHSAILDGFISNYRKLVMDLGMFDQKQCEPNPEKLDYTGKVLVLSPNTVASRKNLKAALDEVKAVYENADATQEEVNAAAAKLNKAIKDLQKKPTIDSGDAIGALLPLLPAFGSDTQVTFPFNDVSKADWYYNSVRSAWYNGLINGVTRYEFQPDSTLTVAQAIKLAAALCQMEREGKVRLTNGETKWYDNYVSYAIANGIIEQSYASYTNAQMNAPIMRGEFVHIFHGAKDGYTAISTVADGAIPDVKTGDKFAAEIYELYRAGILTGSDTKGTFHAASTIKRSEAAAILLRMFDSSARMPITLG